MDNKLYFAQYISLKSFYFENKKYGKERKSEMSRYVNYFSIYKIIEVYIRLLQCETTEFENNINQNLIGRISIQLIN